MGQLVASFVAIGSGAASCLGGMDQVWGPWRCVEERTWAPRPFSPPSAALLMGVVRCPPPVPCLPLAGACSPVLCFRCASINHHGLRASPLLGLWEGRWARYRVAEELTWQCPEDRPAGMLSKAVTNLAAGSGAQEAEPQLQHGRDFGGHWEISHTSQKGKLRPLRGGPIAIWRAN